MSASVEKVTGSCTIGGKSYGVNAISANIAVNTWPFCNVSVLSDSNTDGKAVLIDEKVFNLIGKWLTKIVTSGLPATVKWSSSGGVSDTINGFVTTASQHVSYGNLTMEVTILPDYTQMDSINLQLYSKLCAEQYKLATDQLPKLRNMTLMSFTKELVLAILKLYDPYADDVLLHLPDEIKESYRKQHDVNMEYVHYFYLLLSDSEQYVKDIYGLKGIGLMHALSEEGIKRVVLESLTAAKGSFLSNICEYASQFGLIYVPGTTKPGHFIPKINMLQGNDGGGNNAVVLADITASRTGFLPVSKVVSMSTARGSILYPDGNQKTVGVIAGVADAKIKGPSRTISIAPPRWMGPEFVLTKVLSGGKSPSKKSRTPQDADRNVELSKIAQDAAKYYGKVMNDWCKQELANQLLGGSMTHSVTFLDKFECGLRRREPFGTGFVSGCSVNITVGQKSGAAATVYTYDLVFYKGSNIPKF